MTTAYRPVREIVEDDDESDDEDQVCDVDIYDQTTTELRELLAQIVPDDQNEHRLRLKRQIEIELEERRLGEELQNALQGRADSPGILVDGSGSSHATNAQVAQHPHTIAEPFPVTKRSISFDEVSSSSPSHQNGEHLAVERPVVRSFVSTSSLYPESSRNKPRRREEQTTLPPLPGSPGQASSPRLGDAWSPTGGAEHSVSPKARKAKGEIKSPPAAAQIEKIGTATVEGPPVHPANHKGKLGKGKGKGAQPFRPTPVPGGAAGAGFVIASSSVQQPTNLKKRPVAMASPATTGGGTAGKAGKGMKKGAILAEIDPAPVSSTRMTNSSSAGTSGKGNSAATTGGGVPASSKCRGKKGAATAGVTGRAVGTVTAARGGKPPGPAAANSAHGGTGSSAFAQGNNPADAKATNRTRSNITIAEQHLTKRAGSKEPPARPRGRSSLLSSTTQHEVSIAPTKRDAASSETTGKEDLESLTALENDKAAAQKMQNEGPPADARGDSEGAALEEQGVGDVPASSFSADGQKMGEEADQEADETKGMTYYDDAAATLGGQDEEDELLPDPETLKEEEVMYSTAAEDMTDTCDPTMEEGEDESSATTGTVVNDEGTTERVPPDIDVGHRNETGVVHLNVDQAVENEREHVPQHVDRANSAEEESSKHGEEKASVEDAKPCGEETVEDVHPNTGERTELLAESSIKMQVEIKPAQEDDHKDDRDALLRKYSSSNRLFEVMATMPGSGHQSHDENVSGKSSKDSTHELEWQDRARESPKSRRARIMAMLKEEKARNAAAEQAQEGNASSKAPQSLTQKGSATSGLETSSGKTCSSTSLHQEQDTQRTASPTASKSPRPAEDSADSAGNKKVSDSSPPPDSARTGPEETKEGKGLPGTRPQQRNATTPSTGVQSSPPAEPPPSGGKHHASTSSASKQKSKPARAGGAAGAASRGLDTLDLTPEQVAAATASEIAKDYHGNFFGIFSHFYRAPKDEEYYPRLMRELQEAYRDHFSELTAATAPSNKQKNGSNANSRSTSSTIAAKLQSAKARIPTTRIQRSLQLDVFLGGLEKDQNQNADQGGNNSSSAKPSIPKSLKYDYSTRYYKVIESRQEVYDIVTRSLNRKQDWEELKHGLGTTISNFMWNLLWTWSQPKIDYSKLLVWQKVNHFPGNKHLTRKDRLKRNIERYTKQTCASNQAANAFRIMPQTFILPKEYVAFCQTYAATDEKNREIKDQVTAEVEKENEKSAAPFEKKSVQQLLKQRLKPNYWIMKPAKSSRGRGIYVLDDIGDVSYGELSVIQQYVSNPLLLEGYKWDLRLYVLVTSFQPELCAYLYQEGFARFATVPYTLEDLSTLIHLTNTSIQRQNEHNQKCTRDTLLGGTKIDLKTLRHRLEGIHIKWDVVWHKIQDCILKSLCVAKDHMEENRNAFEIFGYDLMFDANLQCWLIEVNSSPSLGVDHLLDEHVKAPMIDDTIELVQPQAFNREKLLKILSRRCNQQKTAKNPGPQLSLDLAAILDNDLRLQPEILAEAAVEDESPSEEEEETDETDAEGAPTRKTGNKHRKRNLGNYLQIAPSEHWSQILKMKSQLFR
ncbi:unnamed protein product [Amoebophrya sp. A120]|nr:unnamed protein product [Amoebophrya sp. A120]|eukprot:GSA120T00005037001.1